MGRDRELKLVKWLFWPMKDPSQPHDSQHCTMPEFSIYGIIAAVQYTREISYREIVKLRH